METHDEQAVRSRFRQAGESCCFGQQEEVPSGVLPGKGLGSYHCFGPTEDKGKKLFRSAVIQFGSLALLPNA